MLTSVLAMKDLITIICVSPWICYKLFNLAEVFFPPYVHIHRACPYSVFNYIIVNTEDDDNKFHHN